MRGINVNKSIIKKTIGVLALLGSSVGYAATVTITPSVLIANPGTQFSVLVSGTGFPNTSAADLNLTFNAQAVKVLTPTLTAGIVLAAGSPFTNGVIADSPFLSGNATGIQVLAGFATTPTGSFDVITIRFQVNALATPGTAANIVVSDRDGWTDANLFTQIPVTYLDAAGAGAGNPGVTIGGAVVPAPASVWLLATALGFVGVKGVKAKRRVS